MYTSTSTGVSATTMLSSLGFILFANSLTLLSAVAPSTESCHFPLGLQSGWNGEPPREWHGHVTRHSKDSKDLSYIYIVTFKGAFMKAAVSGGRRMKGLPKPYTRECMKEVRPGRFLVAHSETGFTNEKYTCMEFVFRSKNVIQIRISRMAGKPNPGLCKTEKLVLDAWPFIDKVNIFGSYANCPLVGGYNMKVYDKANRNGVCDAFTGETRIESECMEGEGMYFRFRYDICVPNLLHMSSNQRVYCMATWDVGNNSFTIIRHDHKDHQWCLRLPRTAKQSRSFVGFLFKDVYCDPSAFSDISEDYLQLDITRDEPRRMADLCMDDYEACSTWRNPCRHAGSLEHLSCPRTCDLCGDSRPSTCTFDTSLHGEWIDTGPKHQEAIRISDMFVTVAKFRQMQCIKWNEGFYTAGSGASEHMLVTTFENGCRPRYQCVHFQKRTPSILRYKLSQSQIWPFFDDTAGTLINCRSFHYKDDDAPLSDRYRSRHFKTLISKSQRIYVDCRLVEAKEFLAEFSDGSRCNGSVSSEATSSRNTMVLSLERCPRHPRSREFGCLDSWQKGYNDDQFVVTEATGVSSELSCWFFPSLTRDTFYLLPASHCNEGAKAKILSGDLRPDATFKVHPPPMMVGASLRDEQSPLEDNKLSIQNEVETYGGGEKNPIEVDISHKEESLQRKDETFNAQGGASANFHHTCIIFLIVLCTAIYRVVS